MNLNLKIWRQENSEAKGEMTDYQLKDVSPDISFLEMLDYLNIQLIEEGKEPVAFDHDCREGICGMCSLMIDGQAHGPEAKTTTCQLHMRKFKNGDTIYVEPFRANAFPLNKGLKIAQTYNPMIFYFENIDDDTKRHSAQKKFWTLVIT